MDPSRATPGTLDIGCELWITCDLVGTVSVISNVSSRYYESDPD